MRGKMLVLLVVLTLLILQLPAPYAAAARRLDDYSLEISFTATLRGGRIAYTGLPRGAEQLYLPGQPAVPVIAFTVAMPPDKRIAWISVEGLGVPAAYSLDEVGETRGPWNPFTGFAPAAHTPPPAPKADYMEMLWRGVRVARVYLYPYGISSGVIHLYQRIRVTIHLEPASDTPVIVDPDAYAAAASWSLVALGEPPGGRGSSPTVILVVTRPMFLDIAERYAALREMQGYTVYVETVEDIVASGTPGRDIPEKIRNYVEELYTSTDGALRYLLIIGDVSGGTGYPNGPYTIPQLRPWEVPTRYFYNPDGTGQYSHTGDYTPSDWYYATLDTTWDGDGDGVYGEDGDGEDWAPELAVGRLPFHNREDALRYTWAIGNYSRRGIDSWLLTGAVTFFFNQDGWGPYGLQGDTSSEAMWRTLNSSTLLQGTRAIRLYEHYPVYTIIDSPSDYNGNLSDENMAGVLREMHPLIITWFAHGWPHIAWRVIWLYDDGDGVPEIDPETTRRPFLTTNNITRPMTERSGIIFAMSCITAAYDANDELASMFGMPSNESLSEQFVRLAGLWYVGWDRVTWDNVYTWDEQIDPETWVLSSGFVYHAVKALVTGSSPTAMDIGWSVVAAKIWLGSPYMWDSDKKVWWASTLIGDPVQPIGRANTYIEAWPLNATIHPGETLAVHARLLYGGGPVAGETLRLVDAATGETIAANTTGADGSALLRFTPGETGVYRLAVTYDGGDTLMPSRSGVIEVAVRAMNITLYPSTAPPGIWGSARSTGFAPGEHVVLLVNGSSVAEAVAGPDGSVDIVYRVPRLPPGRYLVEMLGDYAGYARGVLVVTEPSIEVSVDGYTLTWSASGLGEHQYYIVSIDGLVAGYVLTDGNGSASASLPLPPLRPGAHRLALVQDPILYAVIHGPLSYPAAVETVFNTSDGVAYMSDVRGLESIVHGLNTTLSTVITRLGVLEERLGSVNASLAEEIRRVRGDLEAVRMALGILEEEVALLNSSVANNTGWIKNTRPILDYLRAKLASTVTGLLELRSRLDELNSTVTGCTRDIAEARALLDSLINDLKQANASLNDLYGKLNGLEDRVGEASDRAAEAAGEAGSVERELGSVRAVAYAALVVAALAIVYGVFSRRTG